MGKHWSQLETHECVCVCVCVCVYFMCMFTYTYIYVQINKEREMLNEYSSFDGKKLEFGKIQYEKSHLRFCLFALVSLDELSRFYNNIVTAIIDFILKEAIIIPFLSIFQLI